MKIYDLKPAMIEKLKQSREKFKQDKIEFEKNLSKMVAEKKSKSFMTRGINLASRYAVQR